MTRLTAHEREISERLMIEALFTEVEVIVRALAKCGLCAGADQSDGFVHDSDCAWLLARAWVERRPLQS